jgi:hypothetical protein
MPNFRTITKYFHFPRFSEACYHVDPTFIIPSKAEVVCANLGGRLATFVDRSKVNDFAAVIQASISFADLWLGKKSVKLSSKKKIYHYDILNYSSCGINHRRQIYNLGAR